MKRPKEIFEVKSKKLLSHNYIHKTLSKALSNDMLVKRERVSKHTSSSSCYMWRCCPCRLVWMRRFPVWFRYQLKNAPFYSRPKYHRRLSSNLSDLVAYPYTKPHDHCHLISSQMLSSFQIPELSDFGN